MPFFIKRCLNFLQFEWLFTLHTALAGVNSIHLSYSHFPSCEDHLVLAGNCSQILLYQVNDSVIGKKTDPLKEFFKAFWLSKINHSSERLKVVYKMHFLFYAIINCQFETSELNNVEKLVQQTVKFYPKSPVKMD